MPPVLTTVLSALTVATALADAPDPACAPADGLDPLLAPGRAILLGEIHGTNEAPDFTDTIACHALAAGLEVIVALELPEVEEAAVRDDDARVVELGCCQLREARRSRSLSPSG